MDLGDRTLKVIHTPGHSPGHHQLYVPVTMIGTIEKGFEGLSNEGKLAQGNGIFDFGEFQIHI